MKWKETEINELTNEELTSASFEVARMHDQHLKARDDPRFKKVFKGNLPTINPTFLQLQFEITTEIKKRNLGV